MLENPLGTATHASLTHATPILRVESLERSLSYYTGALGFRIDWSGPGFGSVSRDRCSIMLCEGSQGHSGTWMWIGVDDVERLHAEWCATGAIIRQGPTNFPWGSLEIQVADLDGHILRFASDGKPDQPFGEFMDSDGSLHSPTWT